MTPKQIIGKLRAQGMTLQQIADRTGMCKASASRYARGITKRMPYDRMARLRQLARVTT